MSKVEADAQPILYLAFSSDRHSSIEVTDFADRFVKDRLQNLSGVADVRIFGERRYSMRIWLDRARLAAYRLTPQDVEDALRRQNIEVPAGIESAAREFTVVAETTCARRSSSSTSCCVRPMAIRCASATWGTPRSGLENERVNVRFNGRRGRGAWRRQAGDRQPAGRLRGGARRAAGDPAGSPGGMRTDLAYDSSIFIRESIDAVFETIAEAVVLVVLVIFLFLRSLRATLIPLVTIPVSLVGAFARCTPSASRSTR